MSYEICSGKEAGDKLRELANKFDNGDISLLITNKDGNRFWGSFEDGMNLVIQGKSVGYYSMSLIDSFDIFDELLKDIPLDMIKHKKLIANVIAPVPN